MLDELCPPVVLLFPKEWRAKLLLLLPSVRMSSVLVSSSCGAHPGWQEKTCCMENRSQTRRQTLGAILMQQRLGDTSGQADKEEDGSWACPGHQVLFPGRRELLLQKKGEERKNRCSNSQSPSEREEASPGMDDRQRKPRERLHRKTDQPEKFPRVILCLIILCLARRVPEVKISWDRR